MKPTIGLRFISLLEPILLSPLSLTSGTSSCGMKSVLFSGLYVNALLKRSNLATLFIYMALVKLYSLANLSLVFFETTNVKSTLLRIFCSYL